MGDEVKADRDWRNVGRPRVACIAKLPHFLVASVVAIHKTTPHNRCVRIRTNQLQAFGQIPRTTKTPEKNAPGDKIIFEAKSQMTYACIHDSCLSQVYISSLLNAVNLPPITCELAQSSVSSQVQSYSPVAAVVQVHEPKAGDTQTVHHTIITQKSTRNLSYSFIF